MSTPLLGVLVTSGGGWQGLALIRCLRQSPRIRVVMVDCHEENVGRYFVDCFERVPPVADGPAFLEALARVCAREEVRLVVPATMFEQPLLAEHRLEWAGGHLTVAVSDASFLEAVGDKRRLYPMLAAQGLPVLPIVDPRRREGPHPLIGKPAGGWGSRDVVVVRGPEDLDRRPGLTETHVFQPLLEGFEEFSADFAIDFRGQPSVPGIRRRVRTSGGFAVISEDAAGPEVESLVGDLSRWAAGAGGRGLFNVQLLAKDGRYVLSDVNPRLGTSAVHWRDTPRNPVIALCRSLEPALSPAPPTRGRRRTVRYLDEMRLEAANTAVGIDALVFDLDDTLIHQKRWMLGKLQQMLALCGDAVADPKAFLREAARIVEEGPRQSLFDELAARLGLSGATREKLIDSYRTAVPDGEVLFPDALPTLDALRRRGIRLALVTDNPPAAQRLKISACALVPWFEAIVFARELGAEKPDRRAFVTAAERLGLPPERLATVGDNPYRDGLPALASGYAAAFVVRRHGTFFNFDPEIARGLCPDPERMRILNGLQELLWQVRPLPAAAARP